MANQVQSQSPGRTLPAFGLLLLSLIPGLVAFLPGFFRAWWNLTDPEQRALISPSSVVVMKILLVVVFVPFVVSIAAVIVSRLRGRAWPEALTTAALWTGCVGVVVFGFVAMTSGGF